MDITQSILNSAQQMGSNKLQAAQAYARQASPTERAARAAAEDFESVFLSQMLAPMFETVETDSMFGGGHAEGIYRSMMVEEIGKEISRAGGIGIADEIYREIMALQEA